MNEFSSDPFGRTSTRNNGDGEGSDPADWVRIEPSLHETLHDTLRLYPINDRDRAVAQLIIEALDDDGYLRQDLQELSELVDIEPALSEDELNIALKLVQSLDKPGVGARTLSECLSLQLEALCPETPGREVALEIVAHHLERLARREQRKNCASPARSCANSIPSRARTTARQKTTTSCPTRSCARSRRTGS